MSKKNLFQSGLVYSTNPEILKHAESDEVTTPPASAQKLKVNLDTTHRAGKVVTLVLGFVGSTADIELLGKSLKSRCGTGGSVKDGQIIVQGDYKKRVTELLIKDGYRVI
jgi:translation initiation factor 1